MKANNRGASGGTRRTGRPPFTGAESRADNARPAESLIELLTRDLEAWRLARGVITKARSVDRR